MKSSRLIVLLLLFGDLIVFFTMQRDFDENGRWALVGGALILAIIWVYLGDSPANKRPVVKRTQQESRIPINQATPDVDIPEVVTTDEMDGASLRERKMAKVKASNEEEAEDMITVEPEDGLEEITLSVEEVHVADEYVVEVSPQSIEDANIAAHINDKRERHEVIRARIEERRRGQMVEIRASTAKMWEEHSSGEDLVGLIQSENHGHNILIEPDTAEAGHVYGATLVRLDPSTILKLRVPLDSGYVVIETDRVAGAEKMSLPEGVPSPEELGLPPLPAPPGASGALAALRDEMSSD